MGPYQKVGVSGSFPHGTEHTFARFGSELQKQDIDRHTIQYEVQIGQSRAQRNQLPAWIRFKLVDDSPR
jgi:hypothetical protein